MRQESIEISKRTAHGECADGWVLSGWCIAPGRRMLELIDDLIRNVFVTLAAVRRRFDHVPLMCSPWSRSAAAARAEIVLGRPLMSGRYNFWLWIDGVDTCTVYPLYANLQFIFLMDCSNLQSTSMKKTHREIPTVRVSPSGSQPNIRACRSTMHLSSQAHFRQEPSGRAVTGST